MLLSERHGDFYLPGSPAVKRGTVNAQGEVSWSGFEPGQRFWVVEAEPDPDVDRPETRAVAITAKVPDPARSSLSSADIQSRLSQSRAPTPPQARIIEGSVGSKPTRAVTEQGMEFAHPKVGLPLAQGEVPSGAPFHRLEDNRDVEVASATITGELHRAVEHPPYLGQHEIPADTEQKSATPLGEATPVEPLARAKKAVARKRSAPKRKPAARKPAPRTASAKPAAKKNAK